jgi:hypothetical protein
MVTRERGAEPMRPAWGSSARIKREVFTGDDGGDVAPGERAFSALRDLAVAAPSPAGGPVPVTSTVLAAGQGEYGRRREVVAGRLTGGPGSKRCAPLPLETRLDSRDWRLCSTAEAFMSLVSRLGVVVTRPSRAPPTLWLGRLVELDPPRRLDLTPARYRGVI